MKRILIIGAGFLQTFIIVKAKELGYETVVVDGNPKSIGFRYADEYKTIDIVDQESCLAYAKEKKVDGVLTAATDYGVLTSAYISQQMSLPGIDYKVAQTVKNKFYIRRTLFTSQIDDLSHYYLISDLNEIDQLRDSIHFPVMVKPCDGSGSKAIKRVNSIQHLRSACRMAIASSNVGKALIEDFIVGKEYGVESFVYNGHVHVLAILDKQMTSPPIYAELGHSLPSGLAIEKEVKTVVSNAIITLGIDFGAVNMDILITSDNKIYIVDVGARMGGNLIGSHIVPLHTGIDYMGNLIRAAVGDEVNMASVGTYAVATKILALKPGKITGLPDFNKITHQCQVHIFHHLQVHDSIREYKNNLDGCGYVLAVSSDKNDCLRRVELAKQMIDEGIVRA
ncbi:MAG: ATP-grasp domain-containing protein [Bacteroidota bacterium]|nr:ATP-grasp domain-containing protein [Bacteroidota bacterium]